MTPKTIEDAMLTALAVKGDDFYVQRFEGTVEALDAWVATVQLPAVAVFYEEGLYDPANEFGTIENGELRFAVWVIHNRLRNYETAMVEPGGIYEILDDVAGVLRGNNLGLAIKPLMRVNEMAVGMDTDSGRVIWSQVWRTGDTG